MRTLRIAIGSDHAGFPLKQDIIGLLSDLGHSHEDFGCYDSTSVDYPDIARPVAKAVADGGFDRGILICATGIGMCIAANKVKGVRAASCSDAFSARRAREHNDANVLCLGQLVLGQGIARDIVKTFLDTEFADGRHARRLEKIRAMECD